MRLTSRLCGLLAALFLCCGGVLAAASCLLLRGHGALSLPAALLLGLSGIVSLAWLGTGASLAGLAVALRPSPSRRAPAA